MTYRKLHNCFLIVELLTLAVRSQEGCNVVLNDLLIYLNAVNNLIADSIN